MKKIKSKVAVSVLDQKKDKIIAISVALALGLAAAFLFAPKAHANEGDQTSDEIQLPSKLKTHKYDH